MKRLFIVFALALGWLCAYSQQAPEIAEKLTAKTVTPSPEVSHSCPVGDVARAASSRARQFVDTLQQFSATEVVEHTELDRNGKAHGTKTAHFTYVAEIRDVPAAKAVVVEEFRDGSAGVEGFPTQLATRGVSAFALIFHPNYIEDFSLDCERLTEMRGRPAWQVHFTQQRTNAFRAYRVQNRRYPVKLQGRAWIAVDTGHVLRLETELVEPISDIQLSQERVTIDYRPVEFRKQGVQLWLPETAEITIGFRGHSYRQRHAFSDFQLFWIDLGEKREEPQAEPEVQK